MKLSFLTRTLCCALVISLISSLAWQGPALCAPLAFAENAQANSADAKNAVDAANGLLQRRLPEHANHFVFEYMPPVVDSDTQKPQDVFEIKSHADGKIVIRGNNGISLASGLHWYLKHYANCHITWRSQQMTLPETLPQVSDTVRIVTPYEYRYYFNYCAFSYTMAYWDWNDWERMIDLLAMFGVNAPLAVTGQEGVWQNVAEKIGLSEEQLQDFFVGPGYLPFGWMGCIDRVGGPLPKEWIEEHVELGKQILERQRAFGMTPILQGFTGHVPRKITEVYPDAELVKLSPWAQFEPTYFLDPSDPLFKKIGSLFVKEQTKLFGTDHLYASDTFIEMAPENNDPEFFKKMGQSVFAAMTDADPQAIWLLQSWAFLNRKVWKHPQVEALMHSVPLGKLLVIDLWCDYGSSWPSRKAFYGQPWIWAIIQNFGGNVSLHGSMNIMANDLRRALDGRGKESGNLVGIGYIMEGIGWNSVIDDFQADLVWRSKVPDVSKWIDRFVTRRYHDESASIVKAWKELGKAIYLEGDQRCRTDNAIFRMPTLGKEKTAGMGRGNRLDGFLVPTWKEFLNASKELRNEDTYQFDLINVTRQALGSVMTQYREEMDAAYKAEDRIAIREVGNKMQTLIADVDELLATHPQYLLGPWLESAKNWGRNDKQRKHYEWNARQMITLWGTRQLNDYAARQWSGLLTDYYAVRWTMFQDALDKSLATKTPWDQQAFEDNVWAFQQEWTRQTKSYPTKPNGKSPAEVSKRLYDKYAADLVKYTELRKQK